MIGIGIPFEAIANPLVSATVHQVDEQMRDVTEVLMTVRKLMKFPDTEVDCVDLEKLEEVISRLLDAQWALIECCHVPDNDEEFEQHKEKTLKSFGKWREEIGL